MEQEPINLKLTPVGDLIKKLNLADTSKNFKLTFTNITDDKDRASFLFKNIDDLREKYDEMRTVLPKVVYVKVKNIKVKYKMKIKKSLDDDHKEDIKKVKQTFNVSKNKGKISTKQNKNKDLDITVNIQKNKRKRPNPSQGKPSVQVNNGSQSDNLVDIMKQIANSLSKTQEKVDTEVFNTYNNIVKAQRVPKQTQEIGTDPEEGFYTPFMSPIPKDTSKNITTPPNPLSFNSRTNQSPSFTIRPKGYTITTSPTTGDNFCIVDNDPQDFTFFQNFFNQDQEQQTKKTDGFLSPTNQAFSLGSTPEPPLPSPNTSFYASTAESPIEVPEDIDQSDSTTPPGDDIPSAPNPKRTFNIFSLFTNNNDSKEPSVVLQPKAKVDAATETIERYISPDDFDTLRKRYLNTNELFQQLNEEREKRLEKQRRANQRLAEKRRQEQINNDNPPNPVGRPRKDAEAGRDLPPTPPPPLLGSVGINDNPIEISTSTGVKPYDIPIGFFVEADNKSKGL